MKKISALLILSIFFAPLLLARIPESLIFWLLAAIGAFFLLPFSRSDEDLNDEDYDNSMHSPVFLARLFVPLCLQVLAVYATRKAGCAAPLGIEIGTLAVFYVLFRMYLRSK
jgi:hypothetical protein